MSFLDKIGGALIGGVVQGLFGEEQQDEANKRQQASDQLQREFAQHGIRWRVKDAKAAGIHPVFALQGGGAAYSPAAVTVNDNFGRDLGQDLSRAISSQETPEQRASRALAEEEMRSRITRNNAEADLFRAGTIEKYARSGQLGPGMPSVRDPNVYADGGRTVLGDAADQVKVEPSQSTSYAGSDPSTAAAKDVMWKKFKLGNGREWWLPNANSASEAMEAVSESLGMQFLIMRENMLRNPYFFDENSHLLPYGDDIKDARTWVSEVLYPGLSKFGHGALDWIRDRYDFRPAEKSGRERGVNWRKRPMRGGG